MYRSSDSAQVGISDSLRNSQPDQAELLSRGWKSENRVFDFQYFQEVLEKDPLPVLKKAGALLGRISENLTRTHYGFLSNLLTIGQNTEHEFNVLWDSITPVPPHPTHRHSQALSSPIPVNNQINRDTIAVEQIFIKLQEAIVIKLLDMLGTPSLIRQCVNGCFYFPIEKFDNFQDLYIANYAEIYWSQHDIWLEINAYVRGQRHYILTGGNLSDWIDKACFGLAAIKTGCQVKIGEVKSDFRLKSFPQDVQDFTDEVTRDVLQKKRTAVLIHGEPGTGKTAWTQAFAQEFLVQLGYVIFILDKQSILDFSPPNYLKNICIIINECDNLAQDRKTEVAQYSHSTEHVLSLLDGTVYESIVDSEHHTVQKLVFLMTCNTTERLDPAILRKGRVDFQKEFTYKFV